MRRKDRRESRMMVLGEPHGKDIELPIPREHRVKSREIAERFLDNLGSRVNKHSMDNRGDFSELFRTTSGEQEAK